MKIEAYTVGPSGMEKLGLSEAALVWRCTKAKEISKIRTTTGWIVRMLYSWSKDLVIIAST